MILKLQRPMVSSEGSTAPWLTYSQDRSVNALLPPDIIPAEVLDAMGDDLKGYFDGDLATDGTLTIGRRVAEQSW